MELSKTVQAALARICDNKDGVGTRLTPEQRAALAAVPVIGMLHEGIGFDVVFRPFPSDGKPPTWDEWLAAQSNAPPTGEHDAESMTYRLIHHVLGASALSGLIDEWSTDEEAVAGAISLYRDLDPNARGLVLLWAHGRWDDPAPDGQRPFLFLKALGWWEDETEPAEIVDEPVE